MSITSDPEIVPTPGTPATTQQAHPWRATARTALAVLLAAATTTPFVVQILDDELSGWEAAGLGGQAIIVAGVITRIMALPVIDKGLSYLGLGSSPIVKQIATGQKPTGL